MQVIKFRSISQRRVINITNVVITSRSINNDKREKAQMNIDRISKKLELNKKIRLDEKLWNSILNDAKILRRVDVAEQVWSAIKSQFDRPNVFLYTNMIEIYGKVGKMNKAIELKEEMEKKGVQPNEYTYTSIIHNYTLSNRYLDGLKSLKEMLLKGIKPQYVTFAAIINAAIINRDIETAITYYDLLCESYPPSLDISPVPHGQLLIVYKEKSDLESMERIIKRLSEMGKLNISSFNMLLQAYSIHKEPQDTLKLFNQVTSLNLKPDIDSFTHVLTQLAQMKSKIYTDAISDVIIQMKRKFHMVLNDEIHQIALQSAKLTDNLEAGLKIWNEIQKPSPECYNILMSMYIDNNISEAERLFKIMEDNNLLNHKAFHTIILGYGKNNNPDKIIKTLEKMKKLGFSHIDQTYNALIRAFLDCGQSEKSFEIINAIQTLTPQVARSEALVYIRQQDTKSLNFLLKVMNNSNLKPSIAMYTYLFKDHFLAKRTNESIQLLHNMKFNMMKPTRYIYSLVIKTLLKSEQIELAFQMFKEALYYGLCPNEAARTRMFEALISNPLVATEEEIEHIKKTIDSLSVEDKEVEEEVEEVEEIEEVEDSSQTEKQMNNNTKTNVRKQKNDYDE